MNKKGQVVEGIIIVIAIGILIGALSSIATFKSRAKEVTSVDAASKIVEMYNAIEDTQLALVEGTINVVDMVDERKAPRPFEEILKGLNPLAKKDVK